jgi:hypothetical protein
MSDQAKDQAKKVAQVAKAAVPKKGSIELFSPAYFAACTVGGMIGTKEREQQSLYFPSKALS